MGYSVGYKGQIVIAKEIRDRLGIEPGWVALQRLVGDHLEVYFAPPEHRTSLKGSLAKHIKVHVPPEKWGEARETAWKGTTRERSTPAERPL